MSRISRRTALTGLTGTGVAALLGAQASMAQVGPPSPIETFVMGPFSLGEWYKKRLAQGNVELLSLRADPGEKKLLEWMNDFHLYLLDARDLSNPKKPRFAAGFPILLATGHVAFDWKDDKHEKQFLARLLKLKANRESTRHNLPIPTSNCLLQIVLEFRGAAGLLSGMSNYGMLEIIEYDLTGKILSVSF